MTFRTGFSIALLTLATFCLPNIQASAALNTRGSILEAKDKLDSILPNSITGEKTTSENVKDYARSKIQEAQTKADELSDSGKAKADALSKETGLEDNIYIEQINDAAKDTAQMVKDSVSHMPTASSTVRTYSETQLDKASNAASQSVEDLKSKIGLVEPSTSEKFKDATRNLKNSIVGESSVADKLKVAAQSLKDKVVGEHSIANKIRNSVQNLKDSVAGESSAADKIKDVAQQAKNIVVGEPSVTDNLKDGAQKVKGSVVGEPSTTEKVKDVASCAYSIATQELHEALEVVLSKSKKFKDLITNISKDQAKTNVPTYSEALAKLQQVVEDAKIDKADL